MSVQYIEIQSIKDERLRNFAYDVDREKIGKDLEAGDNWLSTSEYKRLEAKIREYWYSQPPMLDPVEGEIQKDLRKVKGNTMLKEAWNLLTKPGWQVIRDLWNSVTS